MPKIYIKESKLHGKGIFAARNIKKGEIVFIMKGNKLKFLIDSKEQAKKAGWNWVGISKNEWLDPKDHCIFFNHSCNPNSGIVGHVVFRAINNIKKDEEVTFDYSLNEADIFWDIKCKCGSSNCRKIIKSIQFLPKESYLKNKKYIPEYYKKVYNNFNRELFKTDLDFKNKWISFIRNK